MSGYAEDYTVDELMVGVLAAELKDEDIGMPTAMCFLGDAAVCLAKRTHAKKMIWYSHNGYDPLIDYSLASLHDVERATRTGVFIPDWGDILSLMLRGGVGFQIVAPAQLDQYGNLNNNVIGDHARPDVRLPGSVGMPEIACFHQKTLIYEPRHTEKVFVEKVDFVSGLGQLPGGVEARRAKGIIGGGPVLVVTNLAVMDFEEATGRMRIKSLHPEVTVEEVQDSTGFSLVLPDEIPETERPSEEQVALIRTKIDPQGLRKHRM